MTWVTCQSPTSKETFAVNDRNVKRAVKRNGVTSLEFVDGTPALVIDMSLGDWLAAVQPPPQRIIQGAPPNYGFSKSAESHREDEQQ